ncbi:sigma associated protein [Knoellia sinensis KCTC 19936]|uniref:Sigma associated protein n=1 Tax=Knoellia sinensis KCTC 19936 TaxID=1385520 RepID=A0A0A0J503_9MICO|nr:YciI family protein [Knoellia sinensis]KGN31824.1 sigma associated protein [Knoellia sinensis KCTC 19936]
MTKYMLSVVGTVDDEMPSDEVMQEMYATVGRFNDKLTEAGKWVFGGGLAPIESSTTVDATGDKPTVTDGPFSEAKEFLGGFWIIEAADLDEALQWAKEGSAACGGAVEVRPFDDASQ